VTVAFLIPLNGPPAAVQIAQDAQRTLLRSWSRQDQWSPYYHLYRVGTWLRQQTPPGALVVAEPTLLRIWSLRPQVVGSEDIGFLRDDAALIEAVAALTVRQAEAYQNPQRLLDFAREQGAAYIVVAVDADALPGLTPVHETPAYRVYAVPPAGT
jgi:hypothetical protein